MTRRGGLLLLISLLLSCGTGSEEPVGFVNLTQHTSSDLWAIWRSAQQSVALQVDLNPLQRSLYNAPPDILPGDARALQVVPRQISVASQPDVSSSVLFDATGVDRPDPTGMIACPSPCNVKYAAAYSRYGPEITRFAASWEFQGDNFSMILQYEFENHILQALGYSLQWR